MEVEPRKGVYAIEVRGESGKKLKAKHKIVCYGDGKLYISPEMTGMSEKTAMLCGSIDGISMIVEKNHLCVPIGWLKNERPHLVKDLEEFERKVMRSISGAQGEAEAQ